MFKSIDFYLKWIATVTLIVGIGFNSFGFYPLGPIILLLGGIIWFAVAVLWKDLALMMTNLVASLVSAAGLFYTFLL